VKTEPAILIGAVGTFISTLIPLMAISFGWTDELASEVEAMLLAAWTVLSMLITMLIIRANVWSPASHEAAVTAAKEGNA
jgi:hypothetical protein